MSPEKVIKDYEKGYITRPEAYSIMIPKLDWVKLNHLFWNEREWYNNLYHHANQFPAFEDLDGWEKTIEISGGTVWASQEAYDKWKRDAPRRRLDFRLGVKLIREFEQERVDYKKKWGKEWGE